MNNIKSEVGLDVEDGNDLKTLSQEELAASLAHSIQMESSLRESNEDDPAYMSFVKHMGK